MFKVMEFTHEDLIAIRIGEKIEKKDFEKLDPLLEKVKKDHGKARLYIELEKITDTEPVAMWEDFKTYLSNAGSFKRIAVVGQNGMQQIITKATGPFISGELKYFPHGDSRNAMRWIEE